MKDEVKAFKTDKHSFHPLSSILSFIGGFIMHFSRIASVAVGAVLLCCLVATSVLAQSNDLTATQRVDVMKSRLETMRRSLNNAISSFNAKGSDDKPSADDPRARLRGLEQEVSAVL